MAVMTQKERIAADKEVRGKLGLAMLGANPTNTVSAQTLQIEREILGAQTYAFEIWSRPGLSIQHFASGKEHWLASPVYADRAGAPPTVVITSGLDP